MTSSNLSPIATLRAFKALQKKVANLPRKVQENPQLKRALHDARATAGNLRKADSANAMKIAEALQAKNAVLKSTLAQAEKAYIDNLVNKAFKNLLDLQDRPHHAAVIAAVPAFAKAFSKAEGLLAEILPLTTPDLTQAQLLNRAVAQAWEESKKAAELPASTLIEGEIGKVLDSAGKTVGWILNATDYQLLRIKGIGPGRLRAIRQIVPNERNGTAFAHAFARARKGKGKKGKKKNKK